jgi:hypothetical protein
MTAQIGFVMDAYRRRQHAGSANREIPDVAPSPESQLTATAALYLVPVAIGGSVFR